MGENGYRNTLVAGTLLHGGAYSYRIERVLGQGSFGITYLASVKMQGALGSIDANVKVAIKEFFMKEINGREGSTVTSGSKGGVFADYRKKFVREAANLSKLRHPNIIKVLECFEANGTVYYAMEYIDGGSLDELIGKRGRLSEAETLRYARQIADALAYMHDHNVLHLDLKPGNIMLRDGNAVLIDFGLSKQYDASGNPESSTTVGGGTPGYAPLEQASYHEGKGFPVTMDVYALGGTMLKMLTGQRPPDASEILNDGFPGDRLQGVSPATESVVEKAMSPLRKDRYQSAPELIAAINKLRKAETMVSVVDETERDEETICEIENNEPTGKGESIVIDKVPKPSLKIDWAKVRKYAFSSIALLCVLSLAIFGIWSIRSCVDDNKLQTAFENGLKPEWSKNITAEQGTVLEKLIANMVLVEGGTFMMGATAEQGSDAGRDESPAHQVTLSGYYIGKYEVTQAEWEAVMGTNPSYFKGGNRPVEKVSWDDCQEFIRKLNSLTGLNFSLPTEAQWEYAARGGRNSRGYTYSGSNDIGSVAWYEDNSGNETHPVGMKQANELGLYDMSGNVWEWCSDWYGSYSSSSQTNPTGAASGSYRVNRGGSYYREAWYCRVSDRLSFEPDIRLSNLGLRLAVGLQ